MAVFVALAAAAWGAPALDSGYEGPYDEGNTLCAAWRVAGGEAPYRDFWLMHPPGTAYLLAAAFRLFGTTVAVERGVKIAVGVAAAVLVFALSRRLARRGAAMAAALLFVVAPTQTLSLRPRDLGVLLALAAVLLATRGIEDDEGWRVPLSGAFAGAAVWAKQDLAIYVFAASLLTLAIVAARRRPPGQRERAAAGVALRLSAGAAATAIPLLVLLAVRGSVREFVRQAVLFPVREFSRYRELPVSFWLDGLERAWGDGVRGAALLRAAAVPLVFAALLLALVAALLRSGRRAMRAPDDAGAASAFLVALSGCFLLNVARVRADPEHLGVALPFALAAGAHLIAPRAPARRGAFTFCAGAVATVAFLMATAPPTAGWLRSFRVRSAALARGEGETGLPNAARWVGLPPDILWAARTLAEQVPSGTRTFVGNERHDAIFCSAPLVYFLAGRKGATRYDNLHPGVATTAAVQEEMLRDLEARDVRTIALWSGPPLIEPNASSESSGVRLLDDWIERRFRKVGEEGELSVWERREEEVSVRPGAKR